MCPISKNKMAVLFFLVMGKRIWQMLLAYGWQKDETVCHNVQFPPFIFNLCIASMCVCIDKLCKKAIVNIHCHHINILLCVVFYWCPYIFLFIGHMLQKKILHVWSQMFYQCSVVCALEKNAPKRILNQICICFSFVFPMHTCAFVMWGERKCKWTEWIESFSKLCMKSRLHKIQKWLMEQWRISNASVPLQKWKQVI